MGGDEPVDVSHSTEGTALLATTKGVASVYKPAISEYLMVLIIGFGAQTPWWASSTASDIFNTLLPGTELEFWIGLAYAIALVLSIPLNAVRRVAKSTRVKISFCFATICMGMILLLAIRPLHTAIHDGLVFVTVGDIFLANLCTAVAQGSMYSIVASVSTSYTQALQFGGVLGAVFYAGFRPITKVSITDAVMSGLAYFGVATGICLVSTVITFVFLHRLQKRTSTDVLDARTSSAVSIMGPAATEVYLSDPPPMDAAAPSSSAIGADSYENSSVLAVGRRAWKPLFVIAVEFAFEHALYPGVVSILHGRSDTSWFPVWVFLCFNLGDCIGKGAPKVKAIFSSARPNLPLIALGIEIPVFTALFVCALHSEIWPAVFGNDWYCYAMVLVFAFYHGYLNCSAFLLVPALSGTTRDSQEMGGSLSFAFLAIGIFVGSALAIGVKYTAP